MTNDPTPPIETLSSGKSIAEEYVERELIRSRAHLMRTRIGVIAGVAILGLYMTFVTNGFRENLEPKAAAQLTASMVNQRMDEAEPQFASFIREKVPETIRRAPDYALERLPEFRANIEDRVEADLRGHAQATSDQLHKELAEFLAMHQPQVESMLSEPDKAGAAEEMGAALEERFRAYLAEQPVAGETIKSRLDKTLKAMDEVERRTTRLALNKGLTPSEMKTRHAIAILMRRIDGAAQASPHQVVQPGAIKEAVKTLSDSVPK